MMKRRLLLTTLLIALSLTLGYIGYFLFSPSSLVFLAYSPYWFRKNDWKEVALDLELIKDMGFDGVRIHYEYVVKDGLVEPLLDYTRDLGLKVIWATHATYWGSKYPTIDFPNEIIVGEYKNELKEIANASSKYSHVLYVTVFYPIPFPEPYNITREQCIEHINSLDFNDALEDIMGLVKSYNVPCAMESEGRPWDFPITFIENCDAYFIQPYSGPEWNNIAKPVILDWKYYFQESGKDVYIGEYGFRTQRPSYHWDMGMVSNETMKAQLVQKYLDFASVEFGIITYFAMYDGDGDWGLLNEDRTFRLSGIVAKEWLQNRHAQFKSTLKLTIGALIVLVVAIIATIVWPKYGRSFRRSPAQDQGN